MSLREQAKTVVIKDDSPEIEDLNYVKQFKIKTVRSSITELLGCNSQTIHLAGYKHGKLKDESYMAVNPYNGESILVNHGYKSIVIGTNNPLSIAKLPNGYSIVSFRIPGLITAMLLNDNDKGSTACRGNIHKKFYFTELTDAEEYTTIYSTKLVLEDLDRNSNLFKSIRQLLLTHWDNSQRFIKYDFSENDYNSFAKLIEEIL